MCVCVGLFGFRFGNLLATKPHKAHTTTETPIWTTRLLACGFELRPTCPGVALLNYAFWSSSDHEQGYTRILLTYTTQTGGVSEYHQMNIKLSWWETHTQSEMIIKAIKMNGDKHMFMDIYASLITCHSVSLYIFFPGFLLHITGNGGWYCLWNMSKNLIAVLLIISISRELSFHYPFF